MPKLLNVLLSHMIHQVDLTAKHLFALSSKSHGTNNLKMKMMLELQKSFVCVCVWDILVGLCLLVCKQYVPRFPVAPIRIYSNYYLASSKSKHTRQSIYSAGFSWSISNAETYPTEGSAEQLIMSWKHKALSLKQHLQCEQKSVKARCT